MFEYIDTVIKNILYKYGYDVAMETDGRYLFFKETAKGSIALDRLSPVFAELSFTYTNSFKDQKMNKDEFIRSKGTNALSEICGKRFSLNYLDPEGEPATLRQAQKFSISSLWSVSIEESNLTEVSAIITKCLFVAESCYTVLNSDFYYTNDASRALMEVDLKNKIARPGSGRNSVDLPAALRAASRRNARNAK